MKEKLIINTRSELPLWSRFSSDFFTILLWAGWLYLWYPIYRTLRRVIRLGFDFDDGAIEVLNSISPVSFSHVVVALVGTSGLLLLITLLPSRKVTHPHQAFTTEDYADYFGMPLDQVLAARNASVTTVYHNDLGQMTRFEANEPTLPTAAP